MTTRPTVIGLFGLPGCGKSFILDKIKADPELNHFLCYEGSERIFYLLRPNGAEKFKTMCDDEKKLYRELAIEAIAKEAGKTGKTALVTGHYSFLKFPEEYFFRDRGRWTTDESLRETSIYDQAWTGSDANTYTHIIYLALDSHTLYQRRRDDPAKERPNFANHELMLWQDDELSILRQICKENQILFSVLQADSLTLARVRSLIGRFHDFAHWSNSSFVEQKCDELVEPKGVKLRTVLLLDGDKTISSLDTGSLLSEEVGWVSSFIPVPLIGDKHPFRSRKTLGEETREIFQHAQYSEYAFRQVGLCHEEALTDERFEAKCLAVARKTTLYPEIQHLIERVEQQEHMLTVVVTAGISRIWELVLQQYRSVRVIGGGRPNIPYVVTPEAKGLLAYRLRHVHGLRVWAFGDSPIDIPMLKAADHAIVVVGEASQRSQSMDKALSQAIDEGLQARQLLIPETVPPRLDFERLPRIHFGAVLHISILARSQPAQGRGTQELVVMGPRNGHTEGPPQEQPKEGPEVVTEDVTEDVPEDMTQDVPEDMTEDAPEDMTEDAPEDMTEDDPGYGPEQITEDDPGYGPEAGPEEYSGQVPEAEPKRLTLLHATQKSSCKLLAGPSRDISIHGPALQAQYSRIGQYLAIEYLADLLGLEESPIVDVQGQASISFRLRDEACTAIVALMRAGDPLARGVHKIFPLARYIHAREASDLGPGSFEGISTILLVDTVINTGKTVLEFVRRARGLTSGARMVFVAGVVQAEVIAEGHEMAQLLAEEGVAVVAMRVSRNKYKGTRGLDTGNRMFNTTHME